MNKYLVAYDIDGLNETSETYQGLIAGIRRYAGAMEVERSVWVLKSDESPEVVRDDLWTLMDTDDLLIVVSVGDGGAFEGPLMCGAKPFREFLDS